jgi:hypothetical protein
MDYLHRFFWIEQFESSLITHTNRIRNRSSSTRTLLSTSDPLFCLQSCRCFQGMAREPEIVSQCTLAVKGLLLGLILYLGLTSGLTRNDLMGIHLCTRCVVFVGCLGYRKWTLFPFFCLSLLLQWSASSSLVRLQCISKPEIRSEKSAVARSSSSTWRYWYHFTQSTEEWHTEWMWFRVPHTVAYLHHLSR